MSAGWVGGSVRALAVARRCVGAGAARDLARRPVVDAVRTLSHTVYGSRVAVGMPDAGVERGLAETVVWHLRVLAGWQPPAGVRALRALAGWFEIANVDERMAGWAGTPADPPFALGALAIAWPRLHRARDGQELRAALAASPWGDPGGTDARTIGLHMRAAWARRVGVHVPSARSWAAGGVALLVARERHVLVGVLPAAAAATAARSIGRTAAGAPSWPSFVAALPGPARWVFEPGDGPGELWRAEARWWRRVHADAAALLAAPREGQHRVVGAAVLLAVDAVTVRAALAAAVRCGGTELVDALA
ncbi:hypothetical protein GCM10009682_28390 [Luedemannella flava]|uniref:V-type ATPase subunit n=1 Tax=Luedemannella flava TaxID=349316 RepID=A0ABP4Y610_9ACTN